MNPEIKVLSKEHLHNKVCVVMGTRPGIIKMSPIVRELDKRGIDNFILHTGQHYSHNMDAQFFEDLEIKQPKHRVDIPQDWRTHGAQTAAMLKGAEEVFMEERPKVVLVCGDANTNLAAGLAARKLRLILGHVESGLRSNDWSMPEEHNRVMLDHISELLFAPTEATKNNLAADNVKGEIYVVGNTIVDAVTQHMEIASRKSDVLNDRNIEKRRYIVCTTHREENVDDKHRLTSLLKGVSAAGEATGLPVYLPLHPRTQKRINEFGLSSLIAELSQINVLSPMGYLDFLLFVANAALVLTDSGGIQEEACIHKVPCVTLRDNTERPETLDVGANVLAGTKADDIVSCVLRMINSKAEWTNPIGDGNTSRDIADVVVKFLQAEHGGHGDVI